MRKATGAKKGAREKTRSAHRTKAKAASDSSARAALPEPAVRIELRSLTELQALRWPGNPKGHDLPAIRASILGFGFVLPLVLDERSGKLTAGHGRLEALAELKADGEPPPKRIGVGPDGDWLVPVLLGVDFESEAEAEAYLLADNRTVELGGWRDEDLAAMLGRLARDEPDLAKLTGFKEADLLRLLAQPGAAGGGGSGPVTVPLASRFLVPPFTVLDARQGYWRERKRQWLALGIQSELGRAASRSLDIAGSPERQAGSAPQEGTAVDPRPFRPAAGRRQGLVGDSGPGAFKAGGIKSHAGRRKHLVSGGGSGAGAGSGMPKISRDLEGKLVYEWDEEGPAGTSVFDPVLAELALRWFAPAGGRVLDPFAGGSVRGVVAAHLGFRYVGVDLSGEQLAENRRQAKTIGAALKRAKARWIPPVWHEGDSRDLERLLEPGWEADLVLTCPPYFDLESYSEDARDLSTMSTEAFAAVYREIIGKAIARLRPHRFAFVVVGNARDDSGRLRDLVGLTVEAGEAAGAHFWNDAIIVSPIGSLPLRVGRFFPKARKLGRNHQFAVVLYKGDPARMAEELGEIEVPAELLASLAEREGLEAQP